MARILDEADKLQTKRHESIALIDSLLQSNFLDMFGDPAFNPKGWDTSKNLSDVAEIASGLTKGRKLRDTPTREIPYLAVVNVQDKKLVLDPIKLIEATDSEIERYRLQENDLLLTEGGDRDKLGRGTIWRGEIEECIHQNHIFRVRLTCDILEPDYLSWLIGSEYGKRYFLKQAKQTTGIASINMTQLKKFPLIVPDIKVQEKFTELVSVARSLACKHHEHSAKLDELFAALQQRAFNGAL